MGAPPTAAATLITSILAAQATSPSLTGRLTCVLRWLTRATSRFFTGISALHAVVNLNLTNFPGRPGGSEIKGENSLDMCLYDGNNSTSTRAFLRALRNCDERRDRACREGAFSIRRRGGSQTDPRDRLDYQVLVTNPTTGATEVAANGKTLTWEGTNNRRYLRQVVLPGGKRVMPHYPP